MWLKLAILLSLCFFAHSADQAYGNRPRGVSAEKASLYEERSEFKCFDGSKSIPFGQVNDDYCDCEDGSDEPGTSACNNGRFHCRNHGHSPLEIPSSRVNDLICDCCDGSDEWDSGAECPNVCLQLGEQARKDLDSYRELVQKGYTKRLELAKEGAKSMEEKKAELEKMKKELEDLQPIRVGIEASKNEAEQKETAAKGAEDQTWNDIQDQKQRQQSNEYFGRVDSDKNGKVSIDELKAAIKQANDHELADYEVTGVFGDDTELDTEQFLNKHSDIHRFFQLKRVTEAPPTTTESPAANELDAEEEEEVNDEALEPEEAAHEDEDQEPEREEDKLLYTTKQKPDYTEETKKLIEEANKHRDQFRDTSNRIQDLEAQIRDSENFLQFEYGADYAWAPLKGQCPEVNQAQYTYRLCMFDRAVQKDRNGHGETGLGNWKGWEGPDSDKYSVQKYADGQHCWNGPARSTIVHVECGEELELYDVKEPAKCEYAFWLRAPAACPDPATLKDPFAVHTEL